MYIAACIQRLKTMHAGMLDSRSMPSRLLEEV